MMRRWIVSGVIVLAMVCVGGGAAWAQNGGGLRAITLEDLFAIHPVEGARISPEGKWVAYTVTTSSLAKDEDEQRIWMVPFGGGDAIALTAEGDSSGHPEWSPDGKWLAFLSARKGGRRRLGC